MKLPIENQQVQKTAKVNLKPAGRGKVYLNVLQAQGNSLKASQLPAMVGRFQMGVARALEMTGLFHHMLGDRFNDVWVESTRGGIAFAVRFNAQLKDPDTDIYDHLGALKKAFKSQGIAF